MRVLMIKVGGGMMFACIGGTHKVLTVGLLWCSEKRMGFVNMLVGGSLR